MNQNSEGEANGDRFVTDKVTSPPIKVDCSDWVDTSAGWTFGDFVTEKVTREPIVVDCSHWDALPTEPALAVSVRFDAGAPAEVFARAVGPAARTRPDAATVVVSLRDPAAVAALSDAFRGLQTAGCVIDPAPDGFRVRKAS